jgi:hypothetical protein
VGGFLVHSVPQEVIWSSVYINVPEGTEEVILLLHGELEIWMDVVEVIKKVISGCPSPTNTTHFNLKMEASMFFETLCILPQNYTALQTRTL